MTDALTRAAGTRWHHGPPGAAVALRAAAARRLPGSAAAEAVYLRAGFGPTRPADTQFTDVDCSSLVPAALYGCGLGGNGVRCVYSADRSCGLPVVEIEPSAQTLPPLHVGGQAHRRWRSLQELVVESLVVSLALVVVDVLAHEETQGPFAEGDDATETFPFHRADEPLGIRVEIGTLRRETDRLDTPALQDLAKPPRGERVAVVNQIAGAAQAAIDRVRHIAGHLLHPRAVRLRMDPGDGHAAGLQRDHEEDQVPLEPGQREHLDGEQIAGRAALPGRLQERLPGQAPAPLGSRVDPVVVQDPLHRGPSDLVAEVRERPADPCVPPTGDARPPSGPRARPRHGASTALGVGPAKRQRTQVLPEDPILLPEIRDQIVLVAVHPTSERENEELERRRHGLRLLGRLDQH